LTKKLTDDSFTDVNAMTRKQQQTRKHLAGIARVRSESAA